MTAPAPASAVGDAELVKPCPNDVLLGRGSGRYHFPGNQKWREIIEEKKREYFFADRNTTKTKVATEVFERIRSNGGRFLKLARKPVDDAMKEKVWIEAHESIALEKCKQGLREHYVPESVVNRKESEQQVLQAVFGSSSHVSGHNVSLPRRNAQGYLQAPLGPYEDRASFGVGSTLATSFNRRSVAFPIQQTTHLTSILPPTLLNNMVTRALGTSAFAPSVAPLPWPVHASPSFTDFVALRVGGTPPTSRIPQRMVQNQSVTTGSGRQVPEGVHYFQQLGVKEASPFSVRRQGRTQSDDQSGGATAASIKKKSQPESAVAKASDIDASETEVDQPSSERSYKASSSPMKDVPQEEASDFLMFCLQASDKPRFTDEHEEKENATLTDEERSDVLVDMFGKCCAVSTPKNKRARRDLDPASIKFLVNQMKLELCKILEGEKSAMTEAQRKCPGDEFSDARLEQFLRCEGMNAKMGAQRFVNYWESRRKVFGPEKYLMPMTLSEALRDDLVALETCLTSFLPHTDDSGRQMLFWETRRHTREGYTSESMCRAMWYVVEVMAKEITSIDRGIVLIKWDKGLKIWHYDGLLDDGHAYFLAKCFPVRLAVCHICLAPRLLVPMLKSIVWAVIDKSMRSRMILHEEPENEILDVLSTYGIRREMMPIDAGGTVRINQSEWIANRRAAELEEI